MEPLDDRDTGYCKVEELRFCAPSAYSPIDIKIANLKTAANHSSTAKKNWVKAAQCVLNNENGTANKTDRNWTLVIEKIGQIFKDLKDIRAQGFRGVVIKEDFWTQSLYANLEGSAGFPNLTKLWSAETEGLEKEGKHTQPFEEWVKSHHDEVNKANPTQAKIQYLEHEQAKEYMAHVENGYFYFRDIRGTQLTEQMTRSTIHYTTGSWMELCNLAGGKGYANFVISKEKEFLLGSHAGGVFHHTSFQKGAVVIGAGGLAIGHVPERLKQDEILIELMKTKKRPDVSAQDLFQVFYGKDLPQNIIPMTKPGELRVLTTASGHYKPDRINLIDTLRVCFEKDIDLSRVIIIEECELGESYFASGLEYYQNQGNCIPYRCNGFYIIRDDNDPDQIHLIHKGDVPRASVWEAQGIELIKRNGFDVALSKLYKMTSFGMLTYSSTKFLESADESKTVHPDFWDMGTLEHNDERMIRRMTSSNYAHLQGLLAYLKGCSSPDDYSQIEIQYGSRLFKSPQDFACCLGEK